MSGELLPGDTENGRRFPDGFVWGVATSAYQIEGAAREDGKGPSIWDTYAHTPGTIKDGSTGDVANDHYRRYRDDVRLMKDLGARAYRFSISWPRIFPEGTGQANAKGLDFYSRLVDELLAAGIEPYATLYHWDLPQALQDRLRGWQSRETAEAFGDYAGYIAGKLSDRVGHFFTINEFYSFVDIGHRGIDVAAGGKTVHIHFAPGVTLSPRELNQVRHHAVLGHGLAVQAIRANGRPGTKCGPAENMGIAVPLIETPEHIEAAKKATRELNAPYLTVILEGQYTDAYLENAGPDAPQFTPNDLKVISSPVDFVGLNIYRPTEYVIASQSPPGYRFVPLAISHPKMLSTWHAFGPEAMYWGPRLAESLWQPREMFITENGCGGADEMTAAGKVGDTDRVMFLRSYLTQLQRATAEGLPVKGYFQWSLMDNFEWVDGYGTRFGLVHVDFETQKRTPKMSAEYFRAVVEASAVV
jgi:beta-glucosidase